MIKKKQIQEDILNWFDNELDITISSQEINKNLFHEIYLDSFQYVCFLEYLTNKYKIKVGADLLEFSNQNIEYFIKIILKNV